MIVFYFILIVGEKQEEIHWNPPVLEPTTPPPTSTQKTTPTTLNYTNSVKCDWKEMQGLAGCALGFGTMALGGYVTPKNKTKQNKIK
jgi:hypothetical protein